MKKYHLQRMCLKAKLGSNLRFDVLVPAKRAWNNARYAKNSQ